jgi:hypothetical protein
MRVTHSALPPAWLHDLPPASTPTFDLAVLLLNPKPGVNRILFLFLSSCPQELVLPASKAPELGGPGLKKRFGKK